MTEKSPHIENFPEHTVHEQNGKKSIEFHVHLGPQPTLEGILRVVAKEFPEISREKLLLSGNDENIWLEEEGYFR